MLLGAQTICNDNYVNFSCCELVLQKMMPWTFFLVAFQSGISIQFLSSRKNYVNSAQSKIILLFLFISGSIVTSINFWRPCWSKLLSRTLLRRWNTLCLIRQNQFSTNNFPIIRWKNVLVKNFFRKLQKFLYILKKARDIHILSFPEKMHIFNHELNMQLSSFTYERLVVSAFSDEVLNNFLRVLVS